MVDVVAPIFDADVEQLLVDYLVAGLQSYGFTGTVSTRVPNPRPVESVVLYRTGGPRKDLVTDRPQITIECRAGLEARAFQVAATVRALMNFLDGNGVVLAGQAVYEYVEMVGPYSDFDAVGNQPRYSLTGWVSIRSI